MKIIRKKLKNAIKNIEIAIETAEESHPAECTLIEELKAERIKLWGLIEEIDIG